MRIILGCLLLISMTSFAGGNETNQSFNKAKKYLENDVYFDHRETIYCGAKFDDKKNITAPLGFTTTKYTNRSKRLEWEHVVAAESFGRVFTEWSGHPECVDKKGKPFKGRNCASKINTEYRLMQADMYNLFPSIGAVNALRKNYNFVATLDVDSAFGSCNMKITDKKAEPPESARGRIARTYLYMQDAYKRYNMSKQQAQLMAAWDRMYPTSKWECERARRIAAIQGNENRIMTERCR